MGKANHLNELKAHPAALVLVPHPQHHQEQEHYRGVQMVLIPEAYHLSYAFYCVGISRGVGVNRLVAHDG